MDSSDLYNSIYQLLPVPALILSVDEPDYTIQDANDSFRNIVDDDPANVIGKPFFDVFPFNPADSKYLHGKKMLHSFRNVLQSGIEDFLGVQHYEYISRISGETVSKFYEITNIPLKGANGTVVNIIHSVKNVTESVLQKRDLERSENRFKNLVENSGDAIFIYDKDVNLSYASPAVEHILGYSQDEIFKLDLLEAVHPDDLSVANYSLKMSFENPGMPLIVEPIRLKHKDGSYRWLEGTITNLLNNPSINGIVDNFRDVTERIEASRAMESAKERMEGIIETIDGIFWEANADDFVFTYVSPQSLEMLGYEPAEWIGVDGFWSSKIHPEDREFAVNFCRAQTVKGNNHAFEYRMQKADGSYIWLRDVVSVFMKDEKPVSLRGLMLDIDKRKELQNQLKQAYEIAQIGNWSYDVVEDTLFWSEYVKQIYEVGEDYEPGPKSYQKFYADETTSDVINEASQNAIETNSSFDIEVKINTAKGNEKWIRIVGLPEFKEGELLKIYGNIQDITKRKNAQIKFSETEQRLRDIIEHSTNLFYNHDTKGVLNYLSPQSINFLGYKPEEAKRRWTDFVTEHPQNAVGESITQKAIDTGKTQPPYDLQLKRKDGEIIWAKVTESPIISDGKVIGIAGSLTDITKQKNIEEKLIAANKKLIATQNIAQVGSWEIDLLDDNKVVWSGVTHSIFGVSDDYVPDLNNCFDFFETESRQVIQDAIYNAMDNGSPFDLELEIITPTGDKKWGRCIAEAEFHDGRCVKIAGSIQDVTEKIERESQLRESLERYNIVSKATSDVVWDLNLQTDIMVYNENICNIFGYNRKEIQSATTWWRNLIHPDDRIHANQKLREAIAHRKDRYQSEYRFKAADGTFKHVFDRAFIIKDTNGEPVRIIGAMQDITDIVEEQEQLKLLESVVTNTNDSVVITEAESKGRNGRKIIFVNKAFTNLTGYSSEEILGKTLRVLLNSETDTNTIEKILTSLDTYTPVNEEIKLNKKDGSTFWAKASYLPVFDKNDVCTHWISIAHDITEMKEKEAELLDSLREKETLLSEIHHRVKNNLAIVTSLMQLQAINSENAEVYDSLLNSALRIQSMAEIHEQLYQSSSFSKLKFSESLKKLIKKIVQALRIETKVDLQFEIEHVELTINQGVPCSLLVNEVVTNIIKHGFNGREEGSITVNLKKEQDEISLLIKDNGVGLPADFQNDTDSTMGLKLINLLTDQIGGHNRFYSDNSGTTFELTFRIAERSGSKAV